MYNHYSTLSQKNLSDKYDATVGSQGAYRHLSSMGPREFSDYCDSVERSLNAPGRQQSILAYMREITSKPLEAIEKWREDPTFFRVSIVPGFSINNKVAFFAMTPFVLSRHQHQSVIKVCKQLLVEPGSNRIILAPENSLVKIMDANVNPDSFSPDYREEYKHLLDPSIDLKTQCSIWAELMKFRRIRGARVYPEYYYSSRKKLSRKGNYLKQYLFMPQLHGQDLHMAFSSKSEIQLDPAKIWKPIIQSAMDLYVLHERLGRTHGDIAHGGLRDASNKSPEQSASYGGNIFITEQDKVYDGVLIDFESSVVMNQSYMKYSIPFYGSKPGSPRIARPFDDTFAFVELLNSLGKQCGIPVLQIFPMPANLTPNESPMLTVLQQLGAYYLEEQPRIHEFCTGMAQLKYHHPYSTLMVNNLSKYDASAGMPRQEYHLFAPGVATKFKAYCAGINHQLAQFTPDIQRWMEMSRYAEPLKITKFSPAADFRGEKFSIVPGYFKNGVKNKVVFFLMTPYVLSTTQHQSVVKICKKLIQNPDTRKIEITPENYVVKIIDGHDDYKSFSEDEQSMCEVMLNPGISVAEQCNIWTELMRYRISWREKISPKLAVHGLITQECREMGHSIKLYPPYYYSRRADLSQKGNYLKQYLFMPQFQGQDLNVAFLCASRLPGAHDASLVLNAITACAIDLCVLHELLGRSHGDIAHWKGVASRILEANIMATVEDGKWDTVLIDFEYSVKFGESYKKDIAPFYKLEDKATSRQDTEAFVALVNQIACQLGIRELIMTESLLKIEPLKLSGDIYCVSEMSSITYEMLFKCRSRDIADRFKSWLLSVKNGAEKY